MLPKVLVLDDDRFGIDNHNHNYFFECGAVMPYWMIFFKIEILITYGFFSNSSL